MPVFLVFLDGIRHSSEIEDWELRPELTSFRALFFSGACHWPNDCADAEPSLSGCGACKLNRSAGTALPRASFARPLCLTTLCRSPRAAATTTATSAVSVPTATRPARPSNSGCAAPSAPASMAGQSADPPGGGSKVWPLGGGNRAWSKIHAPAKLEPGVRIRKVAELRLFELLSFPNRAVVAS